MPGHLTSPPTTHPHTLLCSQLEILQNSTDGGSKGSLLHVMDHTQAWLLSWKPKLHLCARMLRSKALL